MSTCRGKGKGARHQIWVIQESTKKTAAVPQPSSYCPSHQHTGHVSPLPGPNSWTHVPPGTDAGGGKQIFSPPPPRYPHLVPGTFFGFVTVLSWDICGVVSHYSASYGSVNSTEFVCRGGPISCSGGRNVTTVTFGSCSPILRHCLRSQESPPLRRSNSNYVQVSLPNGHLRITRIVADPSSGAASRRH